MLTKRIIPCLDIDKGNVVKGVRFGNIQYAGDPVKLAKQYYQQGADELAFLDITASVEKRSTVLDVVKKTAREIFIPFTVGGGIKTVADARNILLAGADKVSINSAAIQNPELISQIANIFGSQCVVVAIDAKKNQEEWEVCVHGGKKRTGKNVLDWAKEVRERGAGEILLTSIDRDGTKKGFDIELTKIISQHVSIPVIASGGAGKKEDFQEVFEKGYADAALAASLFHFGKLQIGEVKEYLRKENIAVRL